MENKIKIVIIGAGPTGLTAAWELVNSQNQEFEVVVLEASDTVGGMAKTVIHNGNIMDMGGHRFFSKEKRVLDWWKTFLSEENKDGQPSLLLTNRATRIYYKKAFFDYPVTLNLANIKSLGFKDSCQIALDYLKAFIHPQKENSLEQFYINRFGKKLYSMFFEEYTEKLCGVHPREISPKWGEQRVRGLSLEAILRRYKKNKRSSVQENKLSESQFYYPKYGPGQLWEAVADEVVERGVQIRINCFVTAIHQGEDGNIDSITVQTSCGEEVVNGDIFISTMPMRELILGMNQVSPQITELARQIPYRAFVTMGLLVDRLAIKVPDCWIYVQDERVKVCRIQFYDNWSPYLSKDREGKVFLALEYFCDKDDAFWSMTEEECCKFAVDEAILLGIFDENTKILDYHREQIEYAYPGYYGVYEEMGKIRDYLAEIDNLYCVGRNGQHEYWNMDKCMMSAWEVVKEIKHKG